MLASDLKWDQLLLGWLSLFYGVVTYSTMLSGQPPGIYLPGHAKNNNAAAVQQSGSGLPLAGAGVTATAENLEALQETEEHSVQCVPDNRNRNKKR